MKLDADIKTMSPGNLRQELMRVRKLIRTHKRKKDNARCWHNDEELYARTLPEGSLHAGKMTLPKEILLKKCGQYIKGQQCSARSCPHKKI